MREKDARQGKGKRSINAQTRPKSHEAHLEQEGDTTARRCKAVLSSESTAERKTAHAEGRKDITIKLKHNLADHAEAIVRPK